MFRPPITLLDSRRLRWIFALALAWGCAASGAQTGTDRPLLDDPRGQTRDSRRSGAQDSARVPDRAFQRSSDSEWHERNGEQPQAAEELEVLPQPFYERFSAYIRQTTGKRVLGALPYSKVGVNNIKLPDSYQVSNGDQIEIQVWGTVNLNYNLRVDTSGRIFIPEIGSIQVQSVRSLDLTPTLTRQFQRLYKGIELRAFVSSARSVDVTVTGQAHVIGLRSIPSSVSVVGAALSFTRPAEGGSRRFIELRRAGRMQQIDLYCFSHGRCGNLPTVLQDNDALHVPARGKLVAIAGAVNRPGIYELAEGEGLSDLLGYAGGLAVDSGADPIDLYSFGTDADQVKNRAYRSVAMQDFCRSAAAAGCTPLSDGDFLDLRPVVSTVKGMVTVTAAGVDPVRFRYTPGMRLIDVIQQPLTRYLSAETVAGINRGDFKSISEIDERLPEIDLESVTLYRLKADARGYDSISADALTALKEGAASAHNIPLQDGDIVVLDTKAAWRSPRAGMTASVRILGEVKRPGRYRFTGLRTLKEVLAQAGGLTDSAAVWSAVLLRNDDSRASLNRRAGVSVLQSVFAHQARQEAVNLAGSAGGVELAAARAPTGASLLPAGSAELAKLIGTRTVIYLDSADGASLTLSPGDIIIVPPVQETIGCYGAVFRQGEITLQGATVTAAAARARCGIVDELSPSIYHFNVRSGAICRDGWLSGCGDLAGGDFIVAVPDVVRKRGMSSFLEYLDVFYKSALSAATLKILTR